MKNSILNNSPEGTRIGDVAGGLTVAGEPLQALLFPGYGYPKIAILFTAEDALSQAKGSGFIDRIASKVGEAVKDDPAFGRNRESFDRQQAVWATADKQSWNLYVRVKESGQFSNENDSEQVPRNNIVK